MESTGSWLCPTELDRRRVVEANDLVRRARTIVAAAVGVALLAAAPWVGWWTLILFGLAVVNLATLEPRLHRAKQPERVAMGTLVYMLALFAVAVGLSGGPRSPLIAWLLIPLAVSPTRFRGRVVIAFGALTALTLLAVTVGVSPSAAIDDPSRIFVILSLMVSAIAVGTALTRAELAHRDAAVLDPLTGVLNRQALASRIVELEQQAELTGETVCFVVCDIDNFKRVNDEHGHDRGDAALNATAYEMRKALRSFELLYRLGGEEFLVVLPGVGLDEGIEVAERLREGVALGRPGGIDLTLSIGVSALAGDHVSYERLFKAADEALYRAKRGGRNRVAVGIADKLDPPARPSMLDPAAALEGRLGGLAPTSVVDV